MDDEADGLLTTGRLATEPEPDMALVQAVRSRRTVRSYQDAPVPREQIERLLRESTHAPSATNRRGWRFILIEDSADLIWLHRRGGSAVLRGARQAVLVCYRGDSDNAAWRDAEQSAAAAIAYFQLLAHAHGIGSCWICHLPPRREVRAHFGIPRPYVPIAVVTLGYYEPGLRMRPRRLEDTSLVCVHRWAFDDAPETFPEVLRRWIRKLLRRLYYLLPRREWLRGWAFKYEKQFHNDRRG